MQELATELCKEQRDLCTKALINHRGDYPGDSVINAQQPKISDVA